MFVFRSYSQFNGTAPNTQQEHAPISPEIMIIVILAFMPGRVNARIQELADFTGFRPAPE